jgi:membrane protein required for colicin V production
VNWLDIVLIVILTLSMVMSLRKGFVREIVGLAAAVLALALASQFYRPAGERLRPYVSTETIAWFGGFLIVFFGVLIAGSLGGFVVSRFLKSIGLSFFDRLLGAVFGLVRGVLVGIGIVLTMVAFIPGDAVVQSRVAPYLIEVSHLVAKAAPPELKENFQRQYERVKDSWHAQAE